jgi:hypothetical protein
MKMGGWLRVVRILRDAIESKRRTPGQEKISYRGYLR